MALNINVTADIINASTKASLDRVAQRQAFRESADDKRTQERAIKERERRRQSSETAAGTADESENNSKTKSLASKRIEEEPAARRRNERVEFAYGCLTRFLADGDSTWRLWNSNTAYFEKIVFSSNSQTSESLDPPVGPSTWTTTDSNSTTPPTSLPAGIPPYTQVFTQGKYQSRTESTIRTIVVPVGGDVAILMLLKNVQSSTGSITYRSRRTITRYEGVPFQKSLRLFSDVKPLSDEEVDDFGGKSASKSYGPDWDDQYPNGVTFFIQDKFDPDAGLTPYLMLVTPYALYTYYNTRVFFEYSWEAISVSSTSFERMYTTEAYLFSKSGVRKIATPPSLADAMISFGNVEPLETSQGIGVEGESPTSRYIGSPRTLQALITQTPDSWSTRWLQFREQVAGSGTRTGFFITELDPATKRPVALNSGRPLFGVNMPTNPPPNVFESSDPEDQYHDLLVAWDWGRPNICKEALLDLGFSEQDLIP